MIEFLNSTAFTAFGAPTSWAEVLGFVTGAWCVWLVARQSVWNWPIGIANNLVWIALVRYRRTFRGLGAAGRLHRARGVGVAQLGARARGWGVGGHRNERDRMGVARRRGNRRNRCSDAAARRGDVLDGPVLGCGHDGPVAAGDLGAGDQTVGVVAAVDYRRPHLHPAVPAQGADADGAALRRLPAAVCSRPARVAAQSRNRTRDGGGTVTTLYRHALVIGKFYPPHRGHHHLVRSAARIADRVTVVVMASAAESIPLADRASWMR